MPTILPFTEMRSPRVRVKVGTMFTLQDAGRCLCQVFLGENKQSINETEKRVSVLKVCLLYKILTWLQFINTDFFIVCQCYLSDYLFTSIVA